MFLYWKDADPINESGRAASKASVCIISQIGKNCKSKMTAGIFCAKESNSLFHIFAKLLTNLQFSKNPLQNSARSFIIYNVGKWVSKKPHFRNESSDQ